MTAKTATRRRTYTPEEREAAQQRDAALAEQADQALADPNIGAKIAAHMVNTSPHMQSYSLRNQGLLMAQADERDMTLVDVDTFKGWQARGRQVRRGERGLWIVRPLNRSTATNKDTAGNDASDKDAATAPPAENEKKEGKKPVRPLFRRMTVFEISQTDAIDGSAPEPTPEVGGAAGLYASLVGQLDKAGYTVTEAEDTDEAAEVDVDQDNKTITVGDPGSVDTLAALAGTLAHLAVARRTAKPPQPRTARDDAPVLVLS